MGFAREGIAAVESALAGKGLEVPAPKATLEKVVEETKVVERECV